MIFEFAAGKKVDAAELKQLLEQSLQVEAKVYVTRFPGTVTVKQEDGSEAAEPRGYEVAIKLSEEKTEQEVLAVLAAHVPEKDEAEERDKERFSNEEQRLASVFARLLQKPQFLNALKNALK